MLQLKLVALFSGLLFCLTGAIAKELGLSTKMINGVKSLTISLVKRRALDQDGLPPVNVKDFNDILHKVRALEETVFVREFYADNQVLANAVEIAYEAVGRNPTHRGTNYAHAFCQYRSFVYGENNLEETNLTKAQMFLLYMVGDESSLTDKMEFATLMDNDLRGEAWLNRFFYMVRFRTKTLSLEGAIWLRNFERVFPPTDGDTRTMAQRMNDIAVGSYSTPRTVSEDAIEVFRVMYEKAHGRGVKFSRVADYKTLDYNYNVVLDEYNARKSQHQPENDADSTTTSGIRAKADDFVKKVQGDCINDLKLLNGVRLVIESAFCAVQEPVEYISSLLDTNSAIGRIIAQDFKAYALEHDFPVLNHDTRTDEQKFLAFALAEWSLGPQNRKFIPYMIHLEELITLRAL